MANFKFVISDGSRSWQVEKDQKDCPVVGRKMGDTLPGDFLNLGGYELQITGGSDREGFPMKKDIEGMARRKVILTRGHGFAAEKEGERRRKLIRGNTISAEIVQINCRVSKRGEKPLEELLGKKEEKAEAGQ